MSQTGWKDSLTLWQEASVFNRRNHTFKTFAEIWDSSKKYTGHLGTYKLASKTGLTDWQILDLSSLRIKFPWHHPWSGQAGSQQNSCQILSHVYPGWTWLSLPPSLIAELPECAYMDCHISLRTGEMARVGLELTRVPFPEPMREPHAAISLFWPLQALPRCTQAHTRPWQHTWFKTPHKHLYRDMFKGTKSYRKQ